MLQALGYTFMDCRGKKVQAGASFLQDICEIRDTNVCGKLQECTFKVACDVTNPLLGQQGATAIFGPQKGIVAEDIVLIDEGMANYANVAEAYTGKSVKEMAGTGAAGGMGFALVSFLNAQLQPGVDLVLEVLQLESEFAEADLVLAGEGKIDGQTAMGKAPVGVARRAKKYGCKVIGFAGCIGDGAEKCLEQGFDAYYEITPSGMPLAQAMQTEVAQENMRRSVREFLLKELCQE